MSIIDDLKIIVVVLVWIALALTALLIGLSLIYKLFYSNYKIYDPKEEEREERLREEKKQLRRAKINRLFKNKKYEIHELKILPKYFNEVSHNIKRFEIRRNDRKFKVGDILILKEYNEEDKSFTGREVKRVIKYILQGPCYGLEEGYCILGL